VICSAGCCTSTNELHERICAPYARTLGIDLQRLVLAQPDTAEQALELTDLLARSGAVDVIVVDSAASLAPRAEVDGEVGDAYNGLQARLIAQALRKLAAPLGKFGTALVVCNQLRERVGQLFGNPEYAPGGRR
jgi:recombination protein RecA